MCVAQALGATLFEHVRVDQRGEVETAAFRRYRLPQYADVPRTEVHFMETADAIGPLGAKSTSVSPFNPVAPASANALRDATGVRFTQVPFTRDAGRAVREGAPEGEGGAEGTIRYESAPRRRRIRRSGRTRW